MIYSIQRLDVVFQGDVLLQDLSLDVDQRDHVVIQVQDVEDSSLFLKACAGLLPTVAGRIYLDGMDLMAQPSTHKTGSLRNRIGFVNEYGGLLRSLNVLDNMKLPLHYHAMCDAREADQRIHELARALEIEPFLEAETNQLHWMHIRFFNLVRTLAMRPRMLFMDKLETGLSRKRVQAALAMVAQHQAREGFGVVRTTSTSHVDFATRIYRIEAGTLVLETTP